MAWASCNRASRVRIKGVRRKLVARSCGGRVGLEVRADRALDLGDCEGEGRDDDCGGSHTSGVAIFDRAFLLLTLCYWESDWLW